MKLFSNLVDFKYFLFSFRFFVRKFSYENKKGNSEKNVNIYFIYSYVLLSFVKGFFILFLLPY